MIVQGTLMTQLVIDHIHPVWLAVVAAHDDFSIVAVAEVVVVIRKGVKIAFRIMGIVMKQRLHVSPDAPVAIPAMEEYDMVAREQRQNGHRHAHLLC